MILIPSILERRLEHVTLQNCYSSECLKILVSTSILKNIMTFTLLYSKKVSYLFTPSFYQVLLCTPHKSIVRFSVTRTLWQESLMHCRNQSVSLATLDFG